MDNTMVNKLRSINVDPLIVPLNVKNLFILIISFIKLFFVVLIQSIKKHIDYRANSNKYWDYYDCCPHISQKFSQQYHMLKSHKHLA